MYRVGDRIRHVVPPAHMDGNRGRIPDERNAGLAVRTNRIEQLKITADLTGIFFKIPFRLPVSIQAHRTWCLKNCRIKTKPAFEYQGHPPRRAREPCQFPYEPGRPAQQAGKLGSGSHHSLNSKSMERKIAQGISLHRACIKLQRDIALQGKSTPQRVLKHLIAQPAAQSHDDYGRHKPLIASRKPGIPGRSGWPASCRAPGRGRSSRQADNGDPQRNEGNTYPLRDLDRLGKEDSCGENHRHKLRRGKRLRDIQRQPR